MFISPGKPQVDMVSLRDNVFTFAAAETMPWLFQLNQFNQLDTALFVRQPQLLHDMSFRPLSLRSRWPQQLAKQGHHSLPTCGTGYYPEAQHMRDSMYPTDEDSHPSTSIRASESPVSSSVSHYSTTGIDERGVTHTSFSNIAAGSELVDLPYWQLVSQGTPAFTPFAHGGNPTWDHTQDGVQPLIAYENYALDAQTNAFSQPVFHPHEALHGLPQPAGGENDSSTNSRLYPSSGMLEAMVLEDEPGRSLWDVSAPETKEAGYAAYRCTGAPEPDMANSTWAKPEAGDETTVSPKSLRIRQTPTPSPSSDSIHTSFIADIHHDEPLVAVEPPPQSGREVPNSARMTRRSGKPLPKSGRRILLPATADATASRRPRSLGSEDPPSPTRRRLTRLRPKPRSAAAGHSSSPPPPLPRPGSPRRIAALRSQFTLGPPPLSRAAARETAVELADRTSKDEFLVRQKQLGKTYKEIRRLGGFTEAESTLRGRYRTLTKCREARVRKPEWSEKDLRLLEQAVRAFSNGSTGGSVKVPWKKVAEYIVAHGGSYHFGNSTCRKRWDELVREQTSLGKSLRQPFFPDEGIDNNHAHLQIGSGGGPRGHGDGGILVYGQGQ
ncbi:hypothetical protein C7999DRAFT_17914 [Corynascus novoguineensis]|uniref:Myb-like domain-containing protein n=1 Tax=Corynascus novoguineensis TaxID=1126955 RepID=A0AAN7CN35_9PEZI|nr:hypothetical protein C7999DRAFT_17914 [Corynascus novoguineensis]